MTTSRIICRLAGTAGLVLALIGTMLTPAGAANIDQDTCYEVMNPGIHQDTCVLVVQAIGDERDIVLDPPPKYPAYVEDLPEGDGGLLPAPNNESGGYACDWTPHQPHYSSGAKGVIAKSSWDCDPGTDFTYYYLTLFVCTVEHPTGREGDWVSSGQCVVGARESGNVTNPSTVQADKRVRYVPAVPKPGITKNGYYIQCVQWYFGVDGKEYRGSQKISGSYGIFSFPT